jgi:hypothetical protein
MGRIATSESVLQEWFTSMLQKTSLALQITSWEQALFVLKKILLGRSRSSESFLFSLVGGRVEINR